MTAEDFCLSHLQFQFYSLGRQARAAGYPKTSCNICGVNEKLGAWMSGFHDQDMEMAGTTNEETA